MEDFVDLMANVWFLYATPIRLPWIGETTPLFMSIFLMLLAIVVHFVQKSFGEDDD